GPDGGDPRRPVPALAIATGPDGGDPRRPVPALAIATRLGG
ncbi:nuclear export factor GLE1, partial [Mycobacterium tuberculosis]